jgi:dynein intermediate chain 2
MRCWCLAAGLPPPGQSWEPPSVATVASLRDPSGAGRAVHALSWNPFVPGRLVVTYDAGAADAGADARAAIWDVASPGSPASVLASSSPLTSLAHNLKDATLLAAGQRSGQVTLFDLRRGPAPADATPPEAAHRGALAGVAWVQCKTGTELMTAGEDGIVAWWDCRKLGERLDAATLRERAGASAGAQAADAPPSLGATCLEYSPAAGPAKFMVGTAQGPILAGSRRAKAPQDRVTASFPGHHGPVRSLARHPAFPKYFLSVGDWTARLWAEDLRVPLLATPYRAPYLAAGVWSPARAALAFTVGSDGRFEAWDLLQSHEMPVLAASVSAGALTGVAVQEGGGGRVCAVGCADGSAAVLQLSAGLAEPQGEEKAAFAAVSTLPASGRDSNASVRFAAPLTLAMRRVRRCWSASAGGSGRWSGAPRRPRRGGGARRRERLSPWAPSPRRSCRDWRTSSWPWWRGGEGRGEEAFPFSSCIPKKYRSEQSLRVEAEGTPTP